MEKDDEVKGSGNHYNTEYRQYDPRLGRWTSLDPLMGYYASQSPYAAFNNNPIYYNDPKGLEGDPPVKKGDSFVADDGSVHKASTDQFEVVADGPKPKILEGSIMKVDEGTINVDHFKFYPDPEMSGVSIDLIFKPNDGMKDINRENSPYRWVQTVKTNIDIDSNGDLLSPFGSEVQFLDISDRHDRSSSIRYTEEGISIGDALGRYPVNKPEPTTVIFKTETSLIKVDGNGSLQKRIATVTFGFAVKPDGSSVSFGLRSVTNPSDFHNKVLESNPTGLKEIVQ